MGSRCLLKAFGLAPPLLALGLLLGAGPVAAAEKNECGCSRNETNNTCTCSKGAKCGCPGDCEPKGCEEKREAQIKKEIAEETRKAAEADKKHRAASGAGEIKQASSKSDSPKESPKAASPKESAKVAAKEEAPAAGGDLKKLTPAQAKQLGRLLDGYLKQHPDARSKNVEE